MSDLRNGSMDADKEREDGVQYEYEYKNRRIAGSFKEKGRRQTEKYSPLGVWQIIGAVAAVAGIAFAVYRFFAPDYLEDFEEDFDDDFDDYFEDEEE